MQKRLTYCGEYRANWPLLQVQYLVESFCFPSAHPCFRYPTCAVAGLYRTGKSYLLNQLLGEKVGFDVGGTVNACTKGIWLWGQPKTLEDGLNVVFLDTEGLGSTSSSQSHDCRIFSLALLLCSYFVYNSRGVIDGNAIDELSLVINLTKHIHVSSSDEGQGNSNLAGSDFHSFFPSFVWVVRDFSLKLIDNGRPITARQYLENALKPQPGFSDEVAQKNHIRALLTNFFRERNCVTLVRPAADETVLRDLGSAPVTVIQTKI